jgi:hypothetical protein
MTMRIYSNQIIFYVNKHTEKEYRKYQQNLCLVFIMLEIAMKTKSLWLLVSVSIKKEIGMPLRRTRT